MLTGNQPRARLARTPWNKGRLIGQKRPLKPKDVWAIRVRLQLEQRKRDLALFNLAIDSKLRGCDLVRLRMKTRRSSPIYCHWIDQSQVNHSNRSELDFDRRLGRIDWG